MRLDDVELRIPQTSVLLQLHGDQAVGQPGRIHRHVQVTQNVGEGADMVFVAMGYQQGPDPRPVLDQVADVGNREVDPWHCLAGEQDAGVDDDDVVAVFQGHHVLADLTETAKRYHSKGRVCVQIDVDLLIQGKWQGGGRPASTVAVRREPCVLCGWFFDCQKKLSCWTGSSSVFSDTWTPFSSSLWRFRKSSSRAARSPELRNAAAGWYTG